MVVALALLLAACQVPAADKFAQLHKGMSESEVIQLLGEPSSRSPVQRSAAGTVTIPAYWQYGDNLSTLASSAMFQDQPPSDRVWAVYFDEQGRTIGWKKPAWDQ